MRKLEKNWITAPIIDTEYKQYVLLAYLQDIKKSYEALSLYPHLSELIDQYCELIQLRDNKLAMAEKFPRSLKGVDLHEIKLEFEREFTEENWVEEITHTVEMAIPYIHQAIQEGKGIYDTIEKNIHVEPVGIEPLQNHEGYFILDSPLFSQTPVYFYKVSLYETSADQYRGIQTQYKVSFAKNLSTTHQSIKRSLIEQNREIPNPTVYSFTTDFSLPLESTYLPVVKRMITRMAQV